MRRAGWRRAAASSRYPAAASPPEFDEAFDHFVLRPRFYRPRPGASFPGHLARAAFATGCFWGGEKGFWKLPGVWATAVGFAGSQFRFPTYARVCDGDTGLAEATLVLFDPASIAFADLLMHFWRCHDPTQGDGQGFDRGTQYRSAIFSWDPDHTKLAQASLSAFDTALNEADFPRRVTTEVMNDFEWWYAEPEHQQYVAKPGNRQYCSAEPTGIEVPGFEAWNLKEHGLSIAETSKHAPRLPPIFWELFDGSIASPNAPVEWGEGIDEAEAIQKIGMERARWEEKRKEAERNSGIVIRACGGCGYSQRAQALQQYFEAALGIRAAVILDIGAATGNFDITVRQPDNSGGAGECFFELVHSKKRGDGFVDSPEKLEGILRAVSTAGLTKSGTVDKAMAGSTPFPSDIVHEADKAVSARAKALVDSHTSIKNSSYVVFGKTRCSYSQRAVSDLKRFLGSKHNETLTTVWLDDRSDGNVILSILVEVTGLETVPNVWAPHGKFIGGSEEVQSYIVDH